MDTKDITMTQEKWDYFYEKLGSHFFRLESEALEAHGADVKKSVYEIIGSTIKLIQVIGVVAGFGFTAFSFVQNLPFFLFGEFLLFVSIIIGLVWTQKIYRSNLKASSKEFARVKDIFAERYSVFKEIYDQARKSIQENREITISRLSMSNLIEANEVLMKNLSLKEKTSYEWDPFIILMILFAGGGLSILFSFATALYRQSNFY